MTTHLSDEQLNEILDSRYSAPHLDSCATCQTRLADLRAIFAALESLPEAPPPRNLTASILSRLPVQKLNPRWSWVLILQAASALGVFIWFASLFQVPAQISTYQLPTLETILLNLTALVSSLQFSLPSLPTFNLQLSTLNLSLLLLSAAALWVVGNTTLLREPTRRRGQ